MDLSFKTYSSPLRVSRDVPFETVRNKFVKGALIFLKSSVITLCSQELTVGTVVTHLGKVNITRVIGSKSSRGHVTALDHQWKSGHGNSKGDRSQSTNQNSLIHEDVWHCQVDHGVP